MSKVELKRFLVLGKNRIKVLSSLSKNPKMFIELVNETKIRKENLSRTLKELLSKRLVKVVNPKVRKGKIFTISKTGKLILRELQKKKLIRE